MLDYSPIHNTYTCTFICALYVRSTYNLNKYNFTDVNISVCMYCTYIFTKKEGSLFFSFVFCARSLCSRYLRRVKAQMPSPWRIGVWRYDVLIFFSSFRSLCYCADAVWIVIDVVGAASILKIWRIFIYVPNCVHKIWHFILKFVLHSKHSHSQAIWWIWKRFFLLLLSRLPFFEIICVCASI